MRGEINMNKNKIISLIIIYINILSCFSANKEINIDEIGIVLECPNELIIGNQDDRNSPIAGNEEFDNRYGIYCNYEKINGSETLLWLGLENKNDILEKLNKKDNSIFFRNKNITHGFFKYENKIIGEEMLSSSSDFVFCYMLYFFKGEYFIIIDVCYFDPFRKMQEKYPQYFEYQPDDTYTWKNEDKVFKMIMDGDKNAPEELVKLYNYFQQIKESIKLY